MKHSKDFTHPNALRRTVRAPSARRRLAARRQQYHHDQRPACTEIEPFAGFVQLDRGVPYLALRRRRGGTVDLDWDEGYLFDPLRFRAALDLAGLDAALALVWKQYGLGKSRGAYVVYAHGGASGCIIGVPPAAGAAMRDVIRRIFDQVLQVMAQEAAL